MMVFNQLVRYCTSAGPWPQLLQPLQVSCCWNLQDYSDQVVGPQSFMHVNLQLQFQHHDYHIWKVCLTFNVWQTTLCTHHIACLAMSSWCARLNPTTPSHLHQHLRRTHILTVSKGQGKTVQSEKQSSDVILVLHDWFVAICRKYIGLVSHSPWVGRGDDKINTNIRACR